MNLSVYVIVIAAILGWLDLPKDCSEFQEGEFIYYNPQENTFDESHIAIRTSNEQIFIDAEKGDTLLYDLKWITACEYKLILKKSNLKEEGLVKIGDTLLVSLEPIDQSSFHYISTFEKHGIKREFKGRMKKAE